MSIQHAIFGGEATADREHSSSLYPLTIVAKGGEEVDLSRYRGQVVLVVNTASKCGFTKQYDALEQLFQRYRDKGFVVLGFPSNDFRAQEPGSDAEIESFCRVNFGVSFEMFPKGSVTGDSMQPMFKALTTKGPPELRGPVRWNFEKFLIDREGYLVGRWRSWVNPLWRSIEGAIVRQLALSKAK